MTTEIENLYTVAMVAERLHVHPQTVRAWIRDGQLGFVYVGGNTKRHLRVTDDQLASFIERRRHDP